MSGLMKADLVWDGGDKISYPPSLGLPRADQMQGTFAEKLTELAGRICYDSLGKGRPSFSSEFVTGVEPHTGEQCTKSVEGYHDHIKTVGHGSVLEHFNFTLKITFENDCDGAGQMMKVAWHFLNRPGVLVLPFHTPEERGLRITLNLRVVRDWRSWTLRLYGNRSLDFYLDEQIRFMLEDQANMLAPNIIPSPPGPNMYGEKDYLLELSLAEIVQPESEHEQWVSLYMSGSRGFSHEQVRHGDYTAISQRSTRYVDESESKWVEHPLVAQFCAENGDTLRTMFPEGTRAVEANAKACYRKVAWGLEEFLKKRGVDATTARKQARGAARGYLGNALHTEMIFSASVAQWKWMLEQRLSAAADAEIRKVYVDVLDVLKHSRYGLAFEGWNVDASPDGIGYVLRKAVGAV